jgi:hypothetical protein
MKAITGRAMPENGADPGSFPSLLAAGGPSRTEPEQAGAASRQPLVGGPAPGAATAQAAPLDYVRFKQGETLPEPVLGAIEKAIGVRLTGADATYDVVDPGEDPANLKPGLANRNRNAILTQSGGAVVDANGDTTAWINRNQCGIDAPQYGVSTEKAMDYFAAQEAVHAHLSSIYDGTGGKPEIEVRDNEVVGEAASSYIDPDMAAQRVLDIVVGMTVLPTYDRLEGLGKKAIEDVAARYDLKKADGTPVDVEKDLIVPLGDQLAKVPATIKTTPEALKAFETEVLSKLQGSNGFTPAAFTRAMQDEIVKDLRGETEEILGSLRDGSYGKAGSKSAATPDPQPRESTSAGLDAGRLLESLLG